jgi:predicted glycosyltransferase
MESCTTSAKSLLNQVLLPKARKEHIRKFKEHWFGPYKIQYCLFNNITFLVTIEKFDPNPVLVNINKLKPYRFQDPTACRGL